MKLEDEHISIIALSNDQVQMYAENNGTLEKKLGLNHLEREVSNSLKTKIFNVLLPTLNKLQPPNYFHTFWSVIDSHKNIMVADIGFKGFPNNLGEIEIGYATYPSFQNQGYMKRAIPLISNWAFHQDHVLAITAETDPTNLVSNHLLQKNLFQVIRKTPDSWFWKRVK